MIIMSVIVLNEPYCLAAPISITSINDLQLIGVDPSYPLDGDYVLAEDLDASSTTGWSEGAGFAPVGSSESPYTGTFDGQSHSISGLFIQRPDTPHQGLFASIGIGGVVKNLNLTDCDITGGNHTGALAGESLGTVIEVSLSGTVSGNEYIGGLVGLNKGVIRLCTTGATVKGTYYVGGLAGWNQEGSIEDCTAEGAVVGIGQAGGVTGNSGGALLRTRAVGPVTVSQFVAGGLVGFNTGAIDICFAAGSVTGTNNVGGLAGINFSGAVRNSYATGNVTGEWNVGGLAGSNEGSGTSTKEIHDKSIEPTEEGILDRCYAIGQVTADSASGGLVGANVGEILSCFWDVDASGTFTSAGGLGRTTAQMMHAATFVGAGWDFEGIWAIEEGASYPWLQALAPVIPGTEVLPLGVLTERSLLHGRQLRFVTPVPAEIMGDLVITLSPVTDTGEWRFSGGGRNTLFTNQVIELIIARSAIRQGMLQSDMMHFNWSDTQNSGVFRILIEARLRHLSTLPQEIVLSTDGQTTVNLGGAGFEAGMQVALLDSDGEPVKTFIPVLVDANTLWVTLNGMGLEPGRASLAVFWPDDDREVLENAVSISAGGLGPHLEARIEAPENMRQNRIYTLWLHYANTGDSDLSAPMFIISSANMRLRQHGNASWRESFIQLVGFGNEEPRSVLPPGTSCSIPISVLTPPGGSGSVYFQLQQMEHNDMPVDWETYREQIPRPSEINETEWPAAWPVIDGYLGSTWGDYLDALYLEARQFSELGMPFYQVEDLLTQAVRRGLALPTACISGRAVQAVTGIPLRDCVIKALRTGDNTLHTAAIEADGRFLLRNLPDGTYAFFVEGWDVDPELRVSILEQADVAGLMIEAFGFEEIAPWTPRTEYRTPAMVSDEEGRVWMLWNQDDQTRWALFEDGEWITSGPGPDTTMPIAALGMGPGMFEEKNTTGLFAVWEHPDADTDRSQLRAALGKITGSEIVWSEICILSGTLYENIKPAAVWREDTGLLMTWLQHDPEIWDDTDLYFGWVDGSCFILPKMDELPLVLQQKVNKAEVCYDFSLYRTIGLANDVPLLGGEKSPFDFRMRGCGEESCEGRSLSGAMTLDIEISKILTGSISGTLASKWQVACQPSPQWVISESSISLSGSLRAEFVKPIRLYIKVIPVGTLYVGGFLEFTLGGGLEWKSNFPEEPIGGVLTGSGGGGGILRLAALDLMGLIEEGVAGVKGEVGIAFVAEWRPPTPLQYAGHCITATGEASVLDGWYSTSISGKWGDACDKYASLGLAPGGPYFMNKSEQSQDWVWIGEPETPYEFTVSYSVNTTPGTGNVYEGLSVLDTVEQDIYGDGSPTLISNGAQTMLIWVKDYEEPGNQLGDRIAWVLAEGNAWSNPAYIEDTISFNSKPGAVFLPDGRVMAVWSQASSADLTAASSLDDIVAAADDAAMLYALFDGDSWSSPAVLADVPGKHVVIAANELGATGATWLSGNALEGYTLWAASHDGVAWEDAVSLGTADAADPPVIAATPDGFIVVWASAHADEQEQALRWLLREAQYTASGWTVLTQLPETLLGKGLKETPRPDSPKKDKLDKSILGECCKGFPQQGPTPASPPLQQGQGGSGNLVQSFDPNEKHSSSGYGDVETQRYILTGDTLEYAIFFENLPTAAAPAQEVIIHDQLPPEVDLSTFRLKEVGWADVLHPVGLQTYIYEGHVFVSDYRPEVNALYRVDIFFSLDVLTRECQWVLRTINPETEDYPEDPLAGFLPPNVPETGIGEGHISFTVRAKEEVPDGTPIENEATITFDTNEPIVTNTVFNLVGNPPTALFTASPTAGEAPLTVMFNNLSVLTPGSLSAWQWEFGDGDSSSEENPTHTFTVSGSYSVRLKVVTPLGESQTEETILVTGVSVEGEGEGEGEGEEQNRHPADMDSDWRISMDDAITYISGWQHGIYPMNYAMRAAYLWQKGEYYSYNPESAPPLCWAPQMKVLLARRTNTVIKNGVYLKDKVIAGSVNLTPPPGTRVWGAELYVPDELIVVDIEGANGAWDELNRKLSWWGIGDAPAVLGYHVYGMPGSYTLEGKANFDGDQSTLSGVEEVQIDDTQGTGTGGPEPESAGQTAREGEFEGENEPDAETPVGMIVVPNIISKSENEALVLLEGLGLKVLVRKEDGKVAKDEVIRQHPAAGTTVDTGAEVTITVSSGNAASLFGCGAGPSCDTDYRGDVLLLILLLFLLVGTCHKIKTHA